MTGFPIWRSIAMIRHSIVTAVRRTNTPRVACVIRVAVQVAELRYSGFNNSG